MQSASPAACVMTRGAGQIPPGHESKTLGVVGDSWRVRGQNLSPSAGNTALIWKNVEIAMKTHFLSVGYLDIALE